MTTMSYLQDNSTRFTLLTGQSLGVAALKPGWLEVFLDRRLNQDDNRGLQQGVTDNRRTPSKFRILVERPTYNMPQMQPEANSYPSLLSLHASLSLLHPVFIMVRQWVKTGNEVLLRPSYSPVGTPLPCDMHLLNLRTLVNGSALPTNATALFLHRMGFDCSYKMWGTSCSLKNGTINISDTFPNYFGPQVEEMSLSLMYSWSKFSKDSNIQLPPMEIVVLKLNRS
ncbi:alpha-mannosidase 2x-like [Centruroides sculpturatus]|uniref:alpha-mannosidase 2x-like n=1 Tax=Centruroides sculpturatus TaxID=218467 RepID=UPI000C6D3607|nr:alpha-mannosidase 2x-like [Centruroides sculpturatus]